MQPGTILTAGLFALTLTASHALAESADIGAQLFGQYCATCHGTSAMGDGPLTEVMSQKVPDLTKLAERNDGQFPMLQVIHIIDGRTGLRGHGGPMPTYGEIFSNAAETGVAGDISAILETRGRTMSIALYLEAIQD